MILHRRNLPKLRSYCAAVTALAILAPALPLDARTKKADKLLAESKLAEDEQDFEKALTLSEEALLLDPADPAYQLEVRRVRFFAAQYHITHGQQIRAKGQIQEAMAEFQRAYQIDPSSDVAEQEIRRTREMIERVKKLEEQGKATLDEISLTPVEAAKRDIQDKVQRLLPVPELKPLNTQPITLRMNNQKPKVLFETVGKLAGVNVLFDPEYDQGGSRNQSIDLNGTTLEQALDYLAVVTHSFWKPLSENTIFITADSPTKRREYEDQVVKVFYLTNVTSPQELQEVITTLRQVVEVQKVFQYTAQNAVVVRAEPDRMALVEKIISDLDKPRGEVLVDMMVMEVDSTRSRSLAAAFAPTGINTSIAFTPRTILQTPSSTSSSGGFNNNSTSTGSSSSSTGTTTTTTTSTSTAIPIANLQYLSGKDFSLTNIPGALLEAIMSDAGTRVLQRPQIRAVDNQKAELHIGDKVPIASGSFQPGVGGVGINPLVNTQFTFLETGVNLEITPRVSQDNEVFLHVVMDISQVKSYVDLGGIQQPIVGQRKTTFDVRMRDGQINMVGGLIQLQDSKTVGGVPGLGNIPFLKRLFTTEQTETDKTELVITMIPHIVRAPEVRPVDLAEVYAGNATNYQVRYAPRPEELAPPSKTTPAGATPPASDTGTAPTIPPVTNPVQPSAPAPVIASHVVFAPGQIQTQLGSSFTITLQGEGVTNLQALESQFKFDPKVLKVNSINAGDLMQRGGPPLQPQRNILNDSGDASVTLSRDPGRGGANGFGALLIVTFQAVGKGQTFVTLPKLVLHDVAGHTGGVNSAPLTVTVK